MGHAPVPFALDALDLEERDHAILERLFRDYERLRLRSGGAFDRGLAVQRLVSHLNQHLRVEEELFYPAARAALGADSALEHAALDHRGTRELIDQLGHTGLDAPDFDATVAVLGAYVRVHMEEEERAIFPRLRLAGLDTVALGVQIAHRLDALAEQVSTRSAAAGRACDARAGSLPAGLAMP